jgi:hypothetical protein
LEIRTAVGVSTSSRSRRLSTSGGAAEGGLAAFCQRDRKAAMDFREVRVFEARECVRAVAPPARDRVVERPFLARSRLPDATAHTFSQRSRADR